MFKSGAATDYTRMRKAQLIETLQDLELEVARLAQTETVEPTTGGMANGDEKRFRDFAEIASDWFWETDEHLRFTYFSGRHDDIGLEIKETLGKTRLEVTIEDTAQRKWLDHLTDLAARKPFKEFRYVSRARDGRVIHLSVSGKAIFDEAGNFKGYRGTGTDITALIEAECELQHSEAQIRGIMDYAPIEIVLKDTEGRYVLTNAQWRKNYNLSDQQAKGRTACDFFPEAFAEPISAHEREVMATGEAATREGAFPKSDGLCDYLTITFPIRDMAGEIINIGAMAVDITDRKRAEAALQESERRFRDMAQASGDWFWETDADHRFTWLSDRAEEITGVPVRFHIGKSRLELAADQVEQEKWRAHLESLEARQPFRDFRYVRRGHDGQLQHMSSSGVPVFDAENKFKGYRGTSADVSAETEAEEMVASAQKRFMAAIESVADGFALFDADDRMVICNSRFKEFNPDLAPKIVPGITFEEMLRDNIADNRILDALGDEEAFIRARMEQHRNPSGPLVQQRRDGRWLEVREERTPEGSTLLVNTDITERMRAEQLVRQLHSAIEVVAEPIALYDADDRMVFCNEAYHALNTGVSETLEPGTSFEEHLRAIVLKGLMPEVKEREEEYLAQRMEQHRNPQGPFEIVRQEGIQLSIHEHKLPDGRTIVICADITERKRAEELVIENEARLAKATEMAKIGYWAWDEIEDRAIHCSEELAKMYGVASGEELAAILCSHAADLERIHPEDRERFCQAVENSKASKDGFDIEYRIINSEGEIRHLHVIEELIIDQHGAVIRSNGVAHDITEQKLVEEEIRNLNAELERRVEARTAELRAAQADLLRKERLATLGQLIATVSHELRNPLGTIRTSVFVLRNEMKETKPIVQRSLERVDRCVIRCDRIIDELLDFTRITELEPEPTPVDAWLEEALSEQALPPGIILRRDFSLGDTAVPFDKDRFRRAIINIFDNACQAMTGEDTPEVGAAERVLTVRTQDRNDRVEVLFEDCGPGISPDVQSRIFEPLFSTKGFGVGLGLPVVKQIMEQHNGGIEIESAEGSGTRVCLWLPRGRSAH